MTNTAWMEKLPVTWRKVLNTLFSWCNFVLSHIKRILLIFMHWHKIDEFLITIWSLNKEKAIKRKEKLRRGLAWKNLAWCEYVFWSVYFVRGFFWGCSVFHSFRTKIVMAWKTAGIVYNARIIPKYYGLNGKRYVGDSRLFTFLFQLLPISPKDRNLLRGFGFQLDPHILQLLTICL